MNSFLINIYNAGDFSAWNTVVFILSVSCVNIVPVIIDSKRRFEAVAFDML